MLYDLTYSRAIELAEHLKALDQTTVHLRGADSGFPFDKAVRVEDGGVHRLSGPVSCYVVAEDEGLTFKLSVDFEGRDANGRGVTLFDRARLRELMIKLPKPAQESFAEMLANKVLPGLEKRTEEIRVALMEQADSEDCIRGLIAMADHEKVVA